MLLGDSITQGCCDGMHLGYRYALWEELQRNSPKGWEFVGSMGNLRNRDDGDRPRKDIRSMYPRYDEFIAQARWHEGALAWRPRRSLL